MSIDQSKKWRDQLDREAVLFYLKRGNHPRVSAAILRTEVSWFGPTSHPELVELLQAMTKEGLIKISSVQNEGAISAEEKYELETG